MKFNFFRVFGRIISINNIFYFKKFIKWYNLNNYKRDI